MKTESGWTLSVGENGFITLGDATGCEHFVGLSLDLLRKLVDAATWKVVARDGQPTERGLYVVTTENRHTKERLPAVVAWGPGTMTSELAWRDASGVPLSVWVVIAYRPLPAPYVPGEEG